MSKKVKEGQGRSWMVFPDTRLTLLVGGGLDWWPVGI